MDSEVRHSAHFPPQSPGAQVSLSLPSKNRVRRRLLGILLILRLFEREILTKSRKQRYSPLIGIQPIETMRLLFARFIAQREEEPGA